jgi:cell wall-associated NlpC family hydrolase
MRKQTLSLVVAALLSTACGAARTASTPVPRPFPGAALPPTASEPRTPNPEPGARSPEPGTPNPELNTNRAPGTGNREILVSTALSFQGTPYRNGGSDPSGFDCSGFVQWVYSRHGTALPREVRDQWRAGDGVDRDELQAGDLVFFETVSRGTAPALSRQTATHVGIALDGDRFVHAPSSTGVVRIERLSTSYWSSRWVGAKRILRRDDIALASSP